MLRPRRGGQDEFYGVKEYRRGENPRWIYWKRSARTGTLVTREMTLVTPPRILLLVEPPSVDHNEITDKGYINQRAVLERRADDVGRLHSARSAEDGAIFPS